MEVKKQFDLYTKPLRTNWRELSGEDAYFAYCDEIFETVQHPRTVDCRKKYPLMFPWMTIPTYEL